jgi:hypothetical protein
MPEPRFEYVKYVLPMRRRYQAAGLTVAGSPRRNRRWPQLAGLDNHGPEYHRQYSRLRNSLEKTK